MESGEQRAGRLKMFQSASKVQSNHSQGSRQGQLLHGLLGFGSVDFTCPFLCLWRKPVQSHLFGWVVTFTAEHLYCCVIQWCLYGEWPRSQDLCSLKETLRWSQMALVVCSDQPFLSAKLSLPYYFILDFCSL